ncbi:hypothetical protein EVAR_18880_1 [Eumeta japonica]|uniref:Uncharacterized protein n=1 Tax=Eumeta variegata TaxID=151549 RepID=A0A4C1V1P8_EUMVA|nr:hypothetical protein EVAR_18880_1 [Eumeta japonica]
MSMVRHALGQFFFYHIARTRKDLSHVDLIDELRISQGKNFAISRRAAAGPGAADPNTRDYAYLARPRPERER